VSVARAGQLTCAAVLQEMLSVDLDEVDVEIISQNEDKTDHKFEIEHHLIIQTIPEGFNSGRRYVLKLPTTESHAWLRLLRELVAKAQAHAADLKMQQDHGGRGLTYYRARSRNFYEHDRTQYFIALLIMFAFAVDIGEAQVLPEDYSAVISVISIIVTI
jgi:hypothetical protein